MLIFARMTLAAALMVSCGHGVDSAQAAPGTTKVPMSERIAILHLSYPDLIYSVTNNVLRLMDNRTVVIDDDRNRKYLAKLQDADIEEQLAQIYPLGKCDTGRKRDFDPGQIRSVAFLRAAYGANLYQVNRTTTLVNWFGTQIRFSTRHGAADALRRVRDQLIQLPAKYHNALKNPTRTLDWVNVPGTEQLSVHAFAFAIDLNPEIRDHWRQNRVGPRRKNIRYRNRMPPAIVAIFERHGFVWGGKWHRFHTAHFEYRPAMIAIARLAEKRGCEEAGK